MRTMSGFSRRQVFTASVPLALSRTRDISK
jgi:hypothetical protein